jgi:hypothetical protein
MENMLISLGILAMTLVGNFSTQVMNIWINDVHLEKPSVLGLEHNTFAHEKNDEVAVKQPPSSYQLKESRFISQSYNNCGPASLSMVLSMWGKNVSQDILASEMRPFNNPAGGIDDKSIFVDEFVRSAEKRGLKALHRPNGTVDLMKKFVANDIPVVVRTWLSPEEDIGHFRIVRGYNDAERVIIQDDSYQGPSLQFDYDTFNQMWKPFNYGYILVYPQDKETLVMKILGAEKNEKIAYDNAVKRAEKELAVAPNDAYANFNLATGYYYKGDYPKAIAAFERAEAGLPWRMLWYQYEPIRAYQRVGNYERVFQLAESVLSNGNPAYSELYQIRGEIYLAQGQKDMARQEFETALYYNQHFTKAKQALGSI